MILDASAVVAIMLGEPSRERLIQAVESAPSVAIGAPTALEATIVLTARIGEQARTLFERLVTETDAEIIAFTNPHRFHALDAWERYGKSRHPAQLNFGDCMAYAVARLADEPLLCTGDDFTHTDLTLQPW